MLRQFANALVAFLDIGVCLRKLVANGDFIISPYSKTYFHFSNFKKLKLATFKTIFVF
jgi:hypothetical protein